MSDPLYNGPDAEIEQLQELLSPYRYEGELPELPERVEEPPREAPRPSALTRPLLLAAGLLLAASLGSRLLPSDTKSWALTQLEGASVCVESDTCSLEEGEWLVTDASSRAMLEVADIGSMEVAPSSRLRLLATGEDQHRLELAQGRIDASVIAPPRLLIVDTPAATAVDLGCAYTLEVDEHGDGDLVVSSGWVSLETKTTTTLVVAGSQASMTVDRGPGLPTWWDASPEMVEAVAAWDQGKVSDPTQILEHARARDTYTLWHLLQRVEPEERGEVLRRIYALAPGTSMDHRGLLSLREDALEQAWSELHPSWG